MSTSNVSILNVFMWSSLTQLEGTDGINMSEFYKDAHSFAGFGVELCSALPCSGTRDYVYPRVRYRGRQKNKNKTIMSLI